MSEKLKLISWNVNGIRAVMNKNFLKLNYFSNQETFLFIKRKITSGIHLELNWTRMV